MKIISVADINGDYETFGKALEIVKKSGADVLAVSGNINGNNVEESDKPAFYDAYRKMVGVVNHIRGTLAANGQNPNVPFYRIVEDLQSGAIKFDNKSNDEVSKTANNYIVLANKAKDAMTDNYKIFKKMVSGLEQEVLVVPGMTDSMLMQGSSFEELNIHKKSREVKNVVFAGYGGFSKTPLDVPKEVEVPFDPNELFGFLSSTNPDVALTYAAPNFAPVMDNGDPMLLAYMYRKHPRLILCGHVALPIQVQNDGKTSIQYAKHRAFAKDADSESYIICPGPLGNQNNGHPYGTFAEIELDKDGEVHPLRLYNAVSGESSELEDKVPK